MSEKHLNPLISLTQKLDDSNIGNIIINLNKVFMIKSNPTGGCVFYFEGGNDYTKVEVRESIVTVRDMIKERRFV